MSADPTENGAQGPGKELEAVDSEVTPVGGASKKLLELSEGGDQNTRAYQAPRELLELARRQRALGFRPSQQPAQGRPSAAPPVPLQSEPAGSRSSVSSREDGRLAATRASTSSLKPSGPRVSSPNPSASQSSSPHGSAKASSERDSSEVASSQKRRTRPISLSPSEFSEGEAAPPRPIEEAPGPRERPTRKPGRSAQGDPGSGEHAEPSAPSISYQPASTRSADSVERAASEPVDDRDAAPPVARSRPSSAFSSEPSSPSPVRLPASLAELAQAASRRDSAPSVPAPSSRLPANDLEPPVPSSLSTNVNALMSRSYFWAIIFVLFIIVGFALARWRVLDLVLPSVR